jgi:Flp pilus assembly protein TadG
MARRQPFAPRWWSADERGVVAVFVAAAASAVVGFAGLATESGAWYLARRDAQNAADAAAHVGAARLGYTSNALRYALADQQNHARAAARDTATRNGYTNALASTSVAVNTPPLSGSYQTGIQSARAVEVIITRDHTRLFSRIFLAGTTQQIRVRSVAVLQAQGPACVLSLSGNLLLNGNTSSTDPNCVLASNNSGANAINVNGQPTITVAGLSSSGGCNNCDRASATISLNQLGAPDPFPGIVNSAPVPSLSDNAVCGDTPNNNQINAAGVAGWSPGAMRSDVVGLGNYYVFCQNLQITGGGTVNLLPGTYFFRGTDLSVTSGNLICTGCSFGGAGVTLVFAANPTNGQVGGVTINSGGVVTLNAPSSGAYDGVLMYRVPTNSVGGSTEVSISGNSATRLAGGLYFPGADVSFTGNAEIASVPVAGAPGGAGDGCLIVVGGSVTLAGTSGTQTRCSTLNPALVPQVQVARLME